VLHEARTATPKPNRTAIAIWMIKLPEPGSRYGSGEKCIFSPVGHAYSVTFSIKRDVTL
jgi:hypothetical protein